MKIFKKLLLVSLILLFSVGCDQVTKDIAVNTLSGQAQAISFLNDMVRLQYAENTGGFLGFGDVLVEGLRFGIFRLFVGAILTALFIYILHSKKLSVVLIIALTLILSGGIGNLIDRIFNDGHVVDFLNVGIGNFRTGIAKSL